MKTCPRGAGCSDCNDQPNSMQNRMKTIIALPTIARNKQMRMTMNKMYPLTGFYRLGSILLLVSFLIAGCAASPSEVRYDNTVKAYTAPSNEKSQAYTTGRYDKVTAYYYLQPGNRPDIQPRPKLVANTQQAPESPPANMKMVLDVSDILFDFDKWVLRANVVPELDEWAAYLKKNPSITADIYGHADSTGPSAYNQGLSEKRAQAVVNYLVSKGVDRSRLIAKGFGESQPIAPNTSKEGRQKNRRVELKL